MKDFKNPVWKEQVTKVVQQIQEKDIKFVRLQFTDINGMLKNLAVSAKNIESIFENGQSFDGSSITGYRPSKNQTWFCTLTQQPSQFAMETKRKIFLPTNLRRLHSTKQTLRRRPTIHS
jgi:glutamine synthetase